MTLISATLPCMSSYPGGKHQSGVYQSLINQITPHDTFISAFAGKCGVLQRIRKCRRAIAIDLDPSPLDWWARRQDVELYNCDSIGWLRHEFGLDRYGTTPPSTSTPDPVSPPAGTPAAVPSLADTIGDARATFVFADPPYPHHVRSGRSRSIYRHEQLTEQDHDRILDTIVKLPCNVMICSIDNDQYHERLKDWRTIRYTVVYRNRKQTTETAWMNYDEPRELHDYQYLGGDRREREKLRRRTRHLQERLTTLPDLEKMALIASAVEMLQTKVG